MDEQNELLRLDGWVASLKSVQFQVSEDERVLKRGYAQRHPVWWDTLMSLGGHNPESIFGNSEPYHLETAEPYHIEIDQKNLEAKMTGVSNERVILQYLHKDIIEDVGIAC